MYRKPLVAVLQSKGVNILEFKNDQKAAQMAQKLLIRAKENEPFITTRLKAVAKLTKAKIVGLQDKLKSAGSLTRKLQDESIKRNIPIDKLAKRNNDTLRYTFIFDIGHYGEGFGDTLRQLKESGYDIPNRRIWNAWRLAGTEMDSGYRGINITVISSQKQKSELPFHTEESFRHKTETHNLYEEFRNPETSKDRKIEITKQILKLARKIKRPKGI